MLIIIIIMIIIIIIMIPIMMIMIMILRMITIRSRVDRVLVVGGSDQKLSWHQEKVAALLLYFETVLFEAKDRAR